VKEEKRVMQDFNDLSRNTGLLSLALIEIKLEIHHINQFKFIIQIFRSCKFGEIKELNGN
jgi:hypothetical protein